MHINWFTVVAQIVNFLILVWLLKRFLYKPILNAIDEREKKIASQIESATNKEAEATKEKNDFQTKNDEFDKQRTALMNKATEDAKTQEQQLLEEARKKYLALSGKLETAMLEEQTQLIKQIADKTKTEVFAIAGKALQSLADADLEGQIVTVFIKRLQNLNDDEKKKLTTALKASNQAIIVKSVFELSKEQKAAIEKSVKEIVENVSELKFENDARLISGIELRANGYVIAWSISEYLNAVEKSISDVIKTSKLGNEENKDARK
jgi:F-type H+-transporting ATPase subunit b